ncbi:MAG: response regulator transcription factor [Lacibacter sp.]|nr:response regulator transcription factor [Lacibacter sp.]
MPNTFDICNISILLLDDKEIYSLGMKELFKQRNPCIHFTCLSHPSQAKEELLTKEYQILLCEILIPNSDVKEFINHCRTKHLHLSIIVTTSIENVKAIKEYFKLGVHGYISKQTTYNEIILAVEKVKNGEKYISTDLNTKLTASLQLTKQNNLTEKEVKVMKLIADGNTVSQISLAMQISPHTVMAHRRSIMKKLNLHTAVEIVKYVFENNLT